MDKSDLLLKNFDILSKKPEEYFDAIKSLIIQLCEENPKEALRCWKEILTDHMDEIKGYWDKTVYPRNSIGELYIYRFIVEVAGEEEFKYAVTDFAKDETMMEILFTRTVFDEGYRMHAVGDAVCYLLRHDEFQPAGTILEAISRNSTFTFYQELWDSVVNRFHYADPDNYAGGGWMAGDCRQSQEIQEFCLGWVEKIPDEEQRAASMAFVLQLC